MEGWTFQAERLSDVIQEVQALWALHWRDSEGYRHGLGYAPNVDEFLKFDRAGRFRLYTLRDERGRLMGQAGFILFTSRHDGSFTAGEDFYYVRREARGTGAATRLLQFALRCLRGESVEHVTASEKMSDAAKHIFEKVGFKQVARQYSLIFGQEE